jgi:integrase
VRHRALTYETVFALLYGIGLRVGEVARLRLGDVDFQRDTLFIVISARVKIDRITARERGVMRRSKSRPPDSCFTRHGCLRG